MVRTAPIKPDSPTFRGGTGEPLVLVHGGGGTLVGHFGGPEIGQGGATLEALVASQPAGVAER